MRKFYFIVSIAIISVYIFFFTNIFDEQKVMIKDIEPYNQVIYPPIEFNYPEIEYRLQEEFKKSKYSYNGKDVFYEGSVAGGNEEVKRVIKIASEHIDEFSNITREIKVAVDDDGKNFNVYYDAELPKGVRGSDYLFHVIVDKKSFEVVGSFIAS